MLFNAELLRQMMQERRGDRSYRQAKEEIRTTIGGNIGHATLFRIETGKVNPDVHTLGVLAAWLNVTPDHFYNPQLLFSA